ncbi:MAG: hypothetical protein H6721_31540 [Sandaracinus sp.]|nr:hypothetical protein [Sandaracinus sp.]
MPLWIIPIAAAGIVAIKAADIVRSFPWPSGTPLPPTGRVPGHLDLCVVVVALDARAAPFFQGVAHRDWGGQLAALRDSRAGWIAAAIRDTVPTELEIAHGMFERVAEDYRTRARSGALDVGPAGYRDVIRREPEVVVVSWVGLVDREIPDTPTEGAIRASDVQVAIERLRAAGRLDLIKHAMVIAPSRGRLPASSVGTLYPELRPLVDPGVPTTFCERCTCPYDRAPCPNCGAS